MTSTDTSPAGDPKADSIEPGVGGEEELLGDSEQVDFRCTNCGAPMTWDPAVDALSCAYCGNIVPVPRGEGFVVERPLHAARGVQRGLGTELRVTGCTNCGARVSFDSVSVSEDCVYCGSSSVLAQEANRNALRPESVVPLDLTDVQVRENFRAWAGRLWFRPNALKSTKSVRAAGVYVPFWTYDCRVHSDWSADSGTYYYVNRPTTVMVNGKPQIRMQRVRKTRWKPAWGERVDVFDDVLVPASLGLPKKSLDKLGGFDIQGLVPYRPEYLAGWRAEEYAIDLDDGWGQAQEEVKAVQERRCAGDVPGDTQRNLRVQNHVSEIRWKHILLPIWSMQYVLSGKTYTVLVHGQTGSVVGDAPYSWLKIIGLILLILGVVLFFLFGLPLFAGAAVLTR